MATKLQRRATIFLLLSSICSTTSAVALADFRPQATRLSPSCNVIYTTPISGCTTNDFINGLPCSKSCIQGMFSLNTAVYQACSSDPRNDQFLIAAFLAGQGITTLCPNVADQSIDPSLPPANSSPAAAAPVPTNSVPITPSPSPESTSTLTIHVTSTSAITSVLPGPPVAFTPTTPLPISPPSHGSSTAPTHSPLNTITSIVLGPPVAFTPSTPVPTPLPSHGSSTSPTKSQPKPTPSSLAATEDNGSTNDSGSTVSRDHCGSPFDWCPAEDTSSASFAKASCLQLLFVNFIIALLGFKNIQHI